MEENILDEIKIRIEKAPFPFRVYGVLAFGSRVKEKAASHSDYDLLIVAEGVNPKRHRRGEEILLIKRCLPPLPFDILLFSTDEVISNFENHNPLFLDMAEEGVVISDRSNFLAPLINGTREYIKSKGIIKWKDGWRFPVKYRVATQLSKVTNRDFAMAMLQDGQRDHAIAKKLIEEGFHDKSVYHSQQSIEKCIKSVLIAFGIFQKTHFVGEVLGKFLKEQKMPESWKTSLLEAAEISETIEPEVSLSRYPGIRDDSLWLPFEEYEREDAEKAEEKAGKVLFITEDFLRYWFSE